MKNFSTKLKEIIYKEVCYQLSLIPEFNLCNLEFTAITFTNLFLKLISVAYVECTVADEYYVNHKGFFAQDLKKIIFNEAIISGEAVIFQVNRNASSGEFIIDGLACCLNFSNFQQYSRGLFFSEKELIRNLKILNDCDKNLNDRN